MIATIIKPIPPTPATEATTPAVYDELVFESAFDKLDSMTEPIIAKIPIIRVIIPIIIKKTIITICVVCPEDNSSSALYAVSKSEAVIKSVFNNSSDILKVLNPPAKAAIIIITINIAKDEPPNIAAIVKSRYASLIFELLLYEGLPFKSAAAIVEDINAVNNAIAENNIIATNKTFAVIYK